MTITDYAQSTPVIDGRLPLPSSQWDPAGERWLVPELTDFGTTVYTYCEENSGCIVEDLVGSTPVAELRLRMMAAKKAWGPEKEEES